MHPFLLAIRSNVLAMRRRAYGARAWLPGLRQRHRLEAMVGPLGYWDELRAYQLRLLKENGLEPQHHLLDIGCGPLQGGIAFIQYLDGSHYVGVDINAERLAAGYEQVGALGLADKNPLLLVSSEFGEPLLGERRFDFIWASQVLYYFNDAAMTDLLRFVAKRLSPGGKFLGDIVGPRHPEYAHPKQSSWLRGIELQTVPGFDRLAAPLGLQVRGLKEIEHYGYPPRLGLRTNLLVEFSQRSPNRG